MFVGAYWSERQESRAEAAKRIERFLQALFAHGEPFNAWFLKGRTRAAARVPITLSPTEIASNLKVNRRELGGEVMSELGLSFGVWNGSRTSLTATVGAFSPYVQNAVVLSFNERPGGIGEAEWKTILLAAIEAFEPDHAVVSSSEHLKLSGAAKPWDAGWFTYKRGGEVEKHPF